MRRSFGAARRKTGPIVEVYYAYATVGADNAIAAVYFDIKHLAGTPAYGTHNFLVERDALGLAVYDLKSVFAMAFIVRVEPPEKRRALHPVEFYEIAHEMTVYDSPLYAAQEIFLQHFLSFFGVSHIAHILFVHGVKIAAFDPATGVPGLYQRIPHTLVSVHYKAFGIRDIGPEKYTCHTLAGAIFYAVAGVYDKPASVLGLLQKLDRSTLAAHIHDYILGYVTCNPLLLAVNVDHATALAQLLGHEVENGGIVSDMVGRIRASTHNSSNSNLRHSDCDLFEVI